MGITQNADQQCVMHSWSDKAYVSNGGTYFSLRNEWDTIKTKYGYSDGDMFKLFNEAFLGDGINGKNYSNFHMIRLMILVQYLFMEGRV